MRKTLGIILLIIVAQPVLYMLFACGWGGPGAAFWNPYGLIPVLLMDVAVFACWLVIEPRKK